MHYQLLSSIEGKAERNFYQKKAVTEPWSVRELQSAIRADLYRGGELEERTPHFPRLLLSGARRAHRRRRHHRSRRGPRIRTWTKRRIRLASVDAPDLATNEGRAARNFVAKELARAKTLVIKSSIADLYGRYVAEVFLTTSDTTLEECFAEGSFLNDQLVRAGHAVVL